MADYRQRFRVFFGEQPQRDLTLWGQPVIEADDRIVYLSGQCGFGQTGSDFGGNVAGGKRLFVLFAGSVGKIDL